MRAQAVVVITAAELVPAHLNISAVIDAAVRVQSSLERCDRCDRLERRTRLHCGSGRDAVQRRRRQRIPRIRALYRCPVFRRDALRENIRVKVRVACHRQNFAGLDIDGYDCPGAAVRVFAHGLIAVFTLKDTAGPHRFDGAFQRVLRGLLQIGVDGQVDILSGDRFGLTQRLDVVAGAVDQNRPDTVAAAQRALHRGFDAVLADQVVAAVAALLDIGIVLAVGDTAHVAENMGSQIFVRIDANRLRGDLHPLQLTAHFLDIGDRLVTDIGGDGAGTIFVELDIFDFFPDDKNLARLLIRESFLFRNRLFVLVFVQLVFFAQRLESLLRGQVGTLGHIPLRVRFLNLQPILADKGLLARVVGKGHAAYIDRRPDAMRILQLVHSLEAVETRIDLIFCAQSLKRLLCRRVFGKAERLEPLLLIAVVGIIELSFFCNFDWEIIYIGVPVFFQ